MSLPVARKAVSLGLLLTLVGCASARANPVLIVDAESRGAQCDDSRPVESVALLTPLCTIQRAVTIAPSRSTVLLRGGDYPGLAIEEKHYTEQTTFKPWSTREQVTVTGISVKRSENVRVEGFVAGSIYTRENSRLAIVGNDVSPGNIESYANVDVLIEGNHVHDVPGYPLTQPEGYGIALYTYQQKQNIRPVVRRNVIERTEADPFHSVSSIDALFELNVARDAFPAPGSGTHVDSLHTQGGRGLVIRNNRFDNIAHGLMFTDKDTQGVVIENNLMTNIAYGYGVNGAVGPGAKIVSNTILSRYGVHLRDVETDPVVLTGVEIKNNIIDHRGAMGPNAYEDYNLWVVRENTKVYGPHDAFGTPAFDPEYRLLPTSVGYNAGTPDRDMGVLIDTWDDPPVVHPPAVEPSTPVPAMNPPALPVAVTEPTGSGSGEVTRRGSSLRIASSCRGGRLRVRVVGPDVRRVRSVRFDMGRARKTDRRAPFTSRAGKEHLGPLRAVRAVVRLRGGKVLRLRARFAACAPSR